MSNYTKHHNRIEPADGRLAVLIPGLGAVGTTLIAGVEAIRQGRSEPVGSLTQLERIEEGPDSPLIREALPMAELDDLVFGGWDIFEGDCYQAAKQANVLESDDLSAVRERLESIRPMPAVFDRDYVRNLDGSNVKDAPTKMGSAEALMEDIERFVTENDCDRAVSVWCGSTEVYTEFQPVHQDLDAFEEGLRNNHEAISPTMIYAYAHLKMGVPFINGTPNPAVDCPALRQLAEDNGVAVAGKDFKTGQTLLKTILAPGLAARKLGVEGWYSTNILGNQDGAVLDDPGSFKSKEKTKASVLETILDKEAYPALYKDLAHTVTIDYYPPRGDNKEGWDNIDFSGWMGYKMQLKMDVLCRDSILAAPVALDLALFGDLAQRSGLDGVQRWLSFYFKSPQVSDGERPVHDLFRQRQMLFDQLQELRERREQTEGEVPALVEHEAEQRSTV